MIMLVCLVLYSCNQRPIATPENGKHIDQVLTGLDIVESDNFGIFLNQKVGLIINQTSADRNGSHIIDLMIDTDVQIVRVFTPEHGFSGTREAGELYENETTDYQNIEFVSLYSFSKSPDLSKIRDLDVLIYDIQDVGSRYYTYISSMTRMMEAAAQVKVPFFILDRPNPINGIVVQGPVLKSDYRSFVGLHPVPVRHGLTSGEIGTMINDELWLKNRIKCDLTVIRLKNWERSDYFDLTGLPWIPPSPNMTDDSTALIYNGFCLLEGTNVSEGRGTDKPFKLFGAPWINGDSLAVILNKARYPGVLFKSANFTPRSIPEKSKRPKLLDESCSGCYMIITDFSSFFPLETAISVLSVLETLYPENFEFLSTKYIDKLYGSSQLRTDILSGKPVNEILASWNNDLDRFKELRKNYLLYP